MRIRTRSAVLTAGLIGAVVALVAGTIIREQRRILEQDSRLRLESVMDGIARLGEEALAGEDALMLISHLMILQKERADLAWASVNYKGHESSIGARETGLVVVSRVLRGRRPVTYTLSTLTASTETAPGVAVAPDGITVRAAGHVRLEVSEKAAPEPLELSLGFRASALRAETERALKPLVTRTLQIAGLFMALGFLGAAALSHALTAPLAAMSATVEAFGDGRFDARVPESGGTELKILALRFNDMAERLEELNAFREDLLHTLGHELNTPLAGLKGYLEMWREGGLPEDPQQRREAFAVLSGAVLRMEDSLGAALSLFRLGEGAAAGERKVVWVDALLDEARALFEPAARAKNVALHGLPPGQVGFFHGPEEPLRLIVSNLVSNALKYTPDGGEVRCGLEDDVRSLRFWVADTGYGIAAEHLPHLFDKFYRVEDGRRRRIPGTGLGLALTRRAVESLGGTIAVSSEPGRGSTFTVILPKKPLPPGAGPAEPLEA